MRCVMVLFSALLVVASASFTATASASTAAATAKAVAPLRPGELGTENEVLRWMNGYRVRRDLVHVPEAIRALSAMGAFRDPGASGVYVGFLAGVIGSNPNKANDVISKIPRFRRRISGSSSRRSPIPVCPIGRERCKGSAPACPRARQ